MLSTTHGFPTGSMPFTLSDLALEKDQLTKPYGLQDPFHTPVVPPQGLDQQATMAGKSKATSQQLASNAATEDEVAVSTDSESSVSIPCGDAQLPQSSSAAGEYRSPTESEAFATEDAATPRVPLKDPALIDFSDFGVIPPSMKPGRRGHQSSRRPSRGRMPLAQKRKIPMHNLPARKHNSMSPTNSSMSASQTTSTCQGPTSTCHGPSSTSRRTPESYSSASSPALKAPFLHNTPIAYQNLASSSLQQQQQQQPSHAAFSARRYSSQLPYGVDSFNHRQVVTAGCRPLDIQQQQSQANLPSTLSHPHMYGASQMQQQQLQAQDAAYYAQIFQEVGKQAHFNTAGGVAADQQTLQGHQLMNEAGMMDQQQQQRLWMQLLQQQQQQQQQHTQQQGFMPYRAGAHQAAGGVRLQPLPSTKDKQPTPSLTHMSPFATQQPLTQGPKDASQAGSQHTAPSLAGCQPSGSTLKPEESGIAVPFSGLSIRMDSDLDADLMEMLHNLQAELDQPAMNAPSFNQTAPITAIPMASTDSTSPVAEQPHMKTEGAQKSPASAAMEQQHAAAKQGQTSHPLMAANRPPPLTILDPAVPSSTFGPSHQLVQQGLMQQSVMQHELMQQQALSQATQHTQLTAEQIRSILQPQSQQLPQQELGNTNMLAWPVQANMLPPRPAALTDMDSLLQLHLQQVLGNWDGAQPSQGMAAAPMLPSQSQGQ